MTSRCFSQHSSNPESLASLEPFHYTSGRWLYRDELERNSRYIQFNLNALCERIIELCPGASSIASLEKTEGNYNKVFTFTLDNSKRVIARLPTSIAGPPKLTTNSEVATIKYLQNNTTIPIPTILDWKDNSANPIGSEYIIMEEAAGVQLQQRWPSMSGEEQIKCIRAICLSIQQMASLNFPAYGSLYVADVSIDCSSKIPLDETFCIGPHCGTVFWDCNIGERRYHKLLRPNRGPWSSVITYSDGLVDTGISRIPPNGEDSVKRPSYHGTVPTHFRLLKNCRDVLHKLSEDPRIQKAAVPTLCHADLHKRNIFVAKDDPTMITALIDWQSSSIEPAFNYADEIPDFAAPAAQLSTEDKSADLNVELCRSAFNLCIHGLVPRLSSASLLDDNMRRLYQYCHRTWKDGAVAIRQELIETSGRWKDMGLPDSCPFSMPSLDEMDTHNKELKSLELAQSLKHKLIHHLNVSSDGWVPADLWEETKAAHREAFEVVLQSVKDAENSDDEPLSEEELRTIWPFDIS